MTDIDTNCANYLDLLCCWLQHVCEDSMFQSWSIVVKQKLFNFGHIEVSSASAATVQADTDPAWKRATLRQWLYF